MSWRTPRTWLRSVLQTDANEQSRGRLGVLRDMAIVDPSKAIESIVKEQMSLAQRLPTYLDDIREEMRGGSGPGARALHNRTVAALKEIDRVTNQLTSRERNPARSLELSYLAERSELLRALSDSVCELTESIGGAPRSGPLGTLTANMAEGLHAVLLAGADAMTSPDDANLEMLHHLTADRGQLMESIRGSLVRGEQTLTIDEHQTLFTSTSLFERIIRLLRRLQAVLAAPPR
jgi:hypothetical protein